MSLPVPGERLDVLDGLRGLAIALVVWYHAWLVSGQGIAGLNFMAEAGFLGVDLFFFISGFCLFFPYARALRDGRAAPTTRRFFMRRAVKILPSYFLALAVFTIVYHARFASPGEALIQLATHVTFMHTLLPLTYGGISGPLWTIGVEVQFYLLFPLVCAMFRRSPLWTYAGLIVFSEVYRLAIGQFGQSANFLFMNQLPAYLDVFGSGMFGAYAFSLLNARITDDAWRPSRTLATSVSVAAFAVAIACLAKVSTIAAHGDDMNGAYDWVNANRVAIGPICILLALSTSFAFRGWRSVVTARALAFLSLISYNLYLWNLEIAVWYHQAGFSAPATFALGIVTAVLLSTAITYAIERPILEADVGAVWTGVRARLLGRAGGSRDGAPDARTAA